MRTESGRYGLPALMPVARALLAEHQYAAAYDYLKTAVDGYEKESMAAELVKALQTMSSIDQILNRNDQANGCCSAPWKLPPGWGATLLP